MEKVNLADKFALFADHWSPRVVGELNDQQVKLVKFVGEFAWHRGAARSRQFRSSGEEELRLVTTE